MRFSIFLFFLLIIFNINAFAQLKINKNQNPEEALSSKTLIKVDVNAHPRLMLNPERIATIRAGLSTTHSFLWKRYLQDLPHMISVSKREVPIEDERYDGDLIIELAFAWLITNRDDLKEIAKTQLLRLAADEEWATNQDLVYLVPAHYIQGLALGYDWLFSVLTPSERTLVSERLGSEAAKQHHRIMQERVWWSTQFLQNHGHSNNASLAFAAAALNGEDERASEWRVTTDDFFSHVFKLLPKDGASVEGYAYSGYGMEYILNYLVLARDEYGLDYTQNESIKKFSDYLIQGLLPKRNEHDWAMTFGDGPRRGWSSTAQHLFTLANLHQNGAAQWMAEETINLKKEGIGSHGWMMMLAYDPSIIPINPASLPTFKYFSEMDQVMMRSSWTDSNATLIGFKCGPFLGRSLSKIAPYDYGAAHQNTDAGSFQIFSHGSFLAIDPGYTGQDRTEDHSTMIFKQHGQLGEVGYFGTGEALRFGHFPTILHTESNPSFDYVVGDVTGAYHPALGLTKFVRHLLYIKPDVLIVADEIALKEKGVVYDVLGEGLEATGGLSHASNGYVVGNEGKASFTFNGTPGIYKIAMMYLDNSPAKGKYSFEVDGETVYSWISKNEMTDDNLSSVSNPVALRKGSIVSFVGKLIPQGTRITKMSVFSETVTEPIDASWFLQLDSKSRIKQSRGHIAATLENATLEIHSLLPKKSVMQIEQHKVAKPEIEPFTPRETKRIVIKPVFKGEDAFLLNLIQGRAASGSSIGNIKTTKNGNTLNITFSLDDKQTIVDWDLKKNSVMLNY